MVARRRQTLRTKSRRAREASQQGDQMSRRNQVLWSAALYATFAAVAVGHIGEGDWGYLLIVVTLAVAAAALFTATLRLRRLQPEAVTAEAAEAA
jgi:fatty acid desaturase